MNRAAKAEVAAIGALEILDVTKEEAAVSLSRISEVANIIPVEGSLPFKIGNRILSVFGMDPNPYTLRFDPNEIRLSVLRLEGRNIVGRVGIPEPINHGSTGQIVHSAFWLADQETNLAT